MSFLDSTRSFTIDSCANAPLLHREGVSGDGGGTAGAEVKFILVVRLVIQGRVRDRMSLVLPCTPDDCQSCAHFFGSMRRATRGGLGQKDWFCSRLQWVPTCVHRDAQGHPIYRSANFSQV